MSLMEVLIEALIEDTNKYLNTITVHIHKKLDEGYEHIKNNRALDAEKAFVNAKNHWVAREEYVKQLREDIEAIETRLSEENNLTSDIKQNIACFREAYYDFKRACETLDEVIKQTAQAISERKAAVKAQSEADIVNDQALEAITVLIHPSASVPPEAPESPGISRTVEPQHNEHFDEMFMLGAFIAALGITAVAIALAALNLAGLAMPGIVLGGFGLATTVIGCSMFASTATSVDKYMSNMTASFDIF